MSSITFVAGTVIPSTWLNDVNTLVYTTFSSGSGTFLVPLRGTNGSAATPTFAFSSSTNTGFYYNGVNSIGWTIGGTASGFLITAGLAIGNPADTLLIRDGVGIAALKNGVNTQELRIYGTTTGTKYLSSKHDGTNALIDTAPTSGAINIGQTNATAVNIKGLATTGLTTIGAGITITGTTTPTGLLDISGASAGQISFPAAQNPSAGANVLDDYEEGTWTPTISFGGASVGVVYNSQSGSYVKVGQMVTAAFGITLTNKGSSSGVAQVDGLPFAAITALFVGQLYWSGMTSSLTCGSLLIGASSLLVMGNTAAGVSLSQLTNTSFANTTIITGSITYRASA